MDIANQLVNGSRNIDKMKSDMHDIISMMNGILHNYRSIMMSKKIISNKSEWRVFTMNDSMYIECWVTVGKEKAKLVYSNEGGAKLPSIEGVQDAYESLPDFITQMFSFFPELKEKCLPIIRAADVF